jgi:hypothetical protein
LDWVDGHGSILPNPLRIHDFRSRISRQPADSD